jgi:hypothetical protein
MPNIHQPMHFSGVNCEQAKAAFPEIYTGKEKIVEAIQYRGRDADITDSYDTLSESIKGIVAPNINVIPMQGYPSFWHDLFTVMGGLYDETKPYMYSLLLARDIPSEVTSLIQDGDVTIFGGNSDSGKLTQWVVFKAAVQTAFGFVFNSDYEKYIIGVAVFDADIRSVSFNGSKPVFLYFNEGYTVPNLVFSVSQFQSTNLQSLKIPACGASMTFGNASAFQATQLSHLEFENGLESLTFTQISTFKTCPLLTTIKFPNTLKSLIFNQAGTFDTCGRVVAIDFGSSLETLRFNQNLTFGYYAKIQSIKFPNTLTTFFNSGNNTFISWNSIKEFIFPDSITHLTLNGSSVITSTSLEYIYIPMPSTLFSMTFNGWGNCPALTKMEFGSNFNYTVNISSANALTTENITDFIFAKLKNNVGQTAKTVTLNAKYGSAGAEPLSADQLLVATSKNWNVAFA